jgi:hypothetical protein
VRTIRSQHLDRHLLSLLMAVMEEPAVLVERVELEVLAEQEVQVELVVQEEPAVREEQVVLVVQEALLALQAVVGSLAASPFHTCHTPTTRFTTRQSEQSASRRPWFSIQANPPSRIQQPRPRSRRTKESNGGTLDLFYFFIQLETNYVLRLSILCAGINQRRFFAF